MPRAPACGANILKLTEVDEKFFSSIKFSADSEYSLRINNIFA